MAQEIVIALAAVTGFGAVFDAVHGKIPNEFIVISLAQLIWLKFVLAGMNGVFSMLGGIFVVFGLGFFTYLMRGMGAGDVKLFAIMGGYLGVTKGCRYFVFTCIMFVLYGGFLCLVDRRIGKKSSTGEKNRIVGMKVPMGPAMWLSLLWFCQAEWL